MERWKKKGVEGRKEGSEQQFQFKKRVQVRGKQAKSKKERKVNGGASSR